MFVLCLFSFFLRKRAPCLRCGKEEKKLRNSNQMNMFFTHIVTLILESGGEFRLNLWSLGIESTSPSPSISFKCETAKVSMTHIIYLLSFLFLFLFLCIVRCLNWLMSSFDDQSTWISSFSYDFSWEFFYSHCLFFFIDSFFYFCYGTGTSASIINWKSTSVTTDKVSTN